MSHCRTIGVLTPVLDGFFFGNLLISITQEAARHNIKVVVIGTTANPSTPLFGSDYIEGWIIIMDAVGHGHQELFRELRVPTVGLNTDLQTEYIITIDNPGIIRMHMDHLYQHGHRRIAYVGDTIFPASRKRYYAYRDNLVRLDLEFEEAWFFDTSQLDPYEIASRLAVNPWKLTALIAVNDRMACELMTHLIKLGVRIPQDLAVIGVDDIPLAHSYRPSLTTCQMPFEEMGIQAVQTIIRHWKREEQPKVLTLTGTPVIRQSCGCDTAAHVESMGELLEYTEKIQYLTNMVARNYNLGLYMQASQYEEITTMTWLEGTPFRRGLAVWEGPNQDSMSCFRFNLDSEQPEERRAFIQPCGPSSFPCLDVLQDHDFMQQENVLTVIPFGASKEVSGVLALVGLGDTFTEPSPINTTFQLANFFASALTRDSLLRDIQTYSRKLEMISNITNDGIWELDTFSGKVTYQGGIHQVLGYDWDEFQSFLEDAASNIHPEDQPVIRAAYRRYLLEGAPFHQECRVRCSDGSYIWLQINGQAVMDENGRLSKVLGSVIDISGRKRTEEQIRQLAYDDTLTGLANRLSFEQQLERILKEADETGGQAALILLDLDRFKLVNDHYGHQSGDRLLQYVASMIQYVSKPADFTARLGGDEFVVVIPQIETSEEAEQFAIKLLACWTDPYLEEDREYYISCSMGISIYPSHGGDAQSLVKNADIALYKAKGLGRNRYELYEPGMNTSPLNRLKMESQLRKALFQEALICHYQPLVEARTGRIIGLEALVRWKSAYGIVSPLEFIPLAEETGLITLIGEWVLREACQTRKLLHQLSCPPLKISVNLSAVQLNQVDFVGRVTQILRETGTCPKGLYLEMTESVMLMDLPRCRQIFQELIEAGLQIAMDDFGTGYSSLSTLKGLPIHMLKIDKSFIQDITSCPDSRAIVNAIIKMAQVLSLEVVAEGVETKEQLELLQEMDIDLAQGYYYSRPVPIVELIELLRASNQFSHPA